MSKYDKMNRQELLVEIHYLEKQIQTLKDLLAVGKSKSKRVDWSNVQQFEGVIDD